MERLNVWYFWGILLGACLLGCRQDKRSVAEKTVYFQPKNRKELGLLLRRERLEQVVFVDRDGSLAQTNRFPKDMAYQCFLLDGNNRVLAIGNPTLNPKLWDLYKAIITGESHKPAVGKSNARAP